MKKTEEYQVPKSRIVSITCDRCKTEIDADDIYELQEVVSLKIEGGYGSVLGDGNVYELDLCQKCVREVLGPYLRLTGNYIWDTDKPQVVSGDALSKIADMIEQSSLPDCAPSVDEDDCD